MVRFYVMRQIGINYLMLCRGCLDGFGSFVPMKLRRFLRTQQRLMLRMWSRGWCGMSWMMRMAILSLR